MKEPVEGPKRVIGDIDYSKWENFDDEEKEAEEKKMQEEYLKNMCSQDHRKEIEIYERPTAEKLEASEKFRAQGNDAFREGNESLAALLYRK